SVDIGDSATLCCCVSKKQYGMMAWFKQPTRKKPQTIVTFYTAAGNKFNEEFEIFHFQLEKSSNCFNLTILNITQADKAVYYCALTRPNIVFAEGTYLKIKGTVTLAVKNILKLLVCLLPLLFIGE
ncbi:immune-type receptor 5 precursor, partial [Silurus meridionalis]